MSNQENQEIDWQAAARQHLDQLKQFGVSLVPTAQGRAFDVPALEDDEPSADQVQEAPASSYSAGQERTTIQEPVPDPTPTKPTSKGKTIDSPQGSLPGLNVSTQGQANQGQSNQGQAKCDQRPYSQRLDTASADQLTVLASEVANCSQCSSLAEFRNQTVFGVGNPNARLVLFGEAPGEQEDRVGEPFVGAAGQLLDKMLEACGLNRQDDVYILNTIKCRPPKNRNPKPDEISNCWGFTERQFDILKPEFICCLGSVAAKTLLRTTQSVGRLRKQFHRYRDSKVLVTYHPAYLLRTSSAKKHAWDDLKMLMNEMGIQIPPKS